jgi:CBS domain-containing protein
MQVRQAMRLMPEVLPAELPVEAALQRLKDGLSNGGIDAWPVADESGLRGMIRTSEIERAAADGGLQKPLAELLPGSGKLPHLHPDHSLSLALERMGTNGLNVLPVVSRANVHLLIGVVVLDDILAAYGVSKRQPFMETD